MRWDPAQYGRYADERGRPFLDLIARIGHPAPRRVVDLGCGPGNLTALLADRWPGSTVEGIDASPEMITEAVARLDDRLSFRVEDVTGWAVPADADVVVSNALLQWVPGHSDLLSRWAADLPGDGWLALQVPANFEAPSHLLMRELADSPKWAPRLAGILRHGDAVATPEEYAALLLDAGLSADVWETTYRHVLTGDDPVLQWVRGTGLRPLLAALDEERATEFCAEYAALLRSAYPTTRHGTVFAFRRVFAVGHKP